MRHGDPDPWHEVLITLPKNIDPDLSKSCIMLIDGGSNNPNSIISEDNIAVKASQAVAHATSSCVAVLRQVPNQRLYFKVTNKLRKNTKQISRTISAWENLVEPKTI